MNRRFAFSILTLFILTQTKAQINEGGLPPSFSYASLRSEIAATDIPVPFNVDDLLLVDEWQVANGAPLKVATSLYTDINVSNSGNWLTLPGGEEIWQLRIQAKGAIALMLYYKTFYIPEGGKLFIYNTDKTQILGAYTQRTNPRGDRFATEFVAGDDLVLEYVSAPSGELPRIEIEEIGYGYNHLSVSTGSELRSSGSCMVNINCSEGAAWQKEKAGICKTIQKIGAQSYLCSGSLVNNTTQDFKPYVLMAYHCMEIFERSKSTVSTPEEMKQWMFYFNYERQGCSDSSPAVQRTMTGCTKVASTPMEGGSDGLLILLDQEIPENYDVYYNGWDRRNTPAQSGVNIHHPGGDYKKISTYTSAIEHATWYGSNSTTGAKDAHWDVIFSATENGHGVTEGGSSGSPLFNEDHLLIGTLSGGTSSCSEPLGSNLFGKLAYHWDKYSKADTARMDIWLDPAKSGVETLQGLSRTPTKPIPTNLEITYQNKNITLSWKAPDSTEKPSNYNIYRTNQLIGTTSGTTYTDSNVNLLGEVIYSVTAEYSDQSESNPLKGSINILEYKAPTDLEIIVANSKVSLSWKAPVYKQAISWATSNPSSVLGVNIPIYFGHLWETDDLKNIAGNTITAVELYAAREATYSLSIIQEDNTYTQSITSPSRSGITSVELTTPFVIDASKELFVIIYAESSSSSIGTMAIDAGPAIIGKGNLISEDGEEWFVLYNGEEAEDDTEEDYNNNFYLVAIISSEKGKEEGNNKVISRLTPTSSVSTETKSSKVQYKSRLEAFEYDKYSLRALSTQSLLLQYPAAFPVITGYNVYRNSTLLTPSTITKLEYTDRTSDGAYTYGVSAVYSGEESEQTLFSSVSVSNIEITEDQTSLSPTVFKEQIRIANAHMVDRIDVYSISGQLIRQINQPNEIINTTLLTPGFYIFKLYTKDGIKTVQAIKK